jgi:hypothetical protein
VSPELLSPKTRVRVLIFLGEVHRTASGSAVSDRTVGPCCCTERWWTLWRVITFSALLKKENNNNNNNNFLTLKESYY